MLTALFGLLVFAGQLALAVGAVQSLRTGKLEPYSGWMQAAGKSPISRVEMPVRFWTLWASQVWVYLLPLLALAAVLIL